MSQQDGEQRPDIIFFMLDQLSAKWLEDPAKRAIPTPNIDWLRSQGVTFTNTYASNPVCCASRASLATGLTSRGHGVLQNGYELDPTLPNFMRLLQKNGWRSGAFGKLHLNVHFHGVHPDYRPYGFDVVHNTEDPRAGEWLDWVEQTYPQHYEAALATIWATKIPELSAYGPQEVNLAERIERVRSAFNWATDSHPGNTPRHYTLPFPEAMSQTAWITSHALDFIEQSDPYQPLYAHISYVQPHSPFCPPAEFMDQVDTGAIPEPVPPEWVGDPQSPVCFAASEGVHPEIPEDWRLRRQYYFADLVHLDRQLGKVVDQLQRSGRWENTYLFFLADHGELLYDHGFTGKGERHYDACIRVPLTIVGPGLARNRTVDAFVQLEDIFPTVLEIAGIPLPELPVLGEYLQQTPLSYPGHSLLPWRRGDTPNWLRDGAYVESYNNIDSCSPRNWARTVRTNAWRYTLYPGGAGEQLFDLRQDPDERANLAGDSGYRAIRAEMRDRLLDLVILQDYPHSRRNLFAMGVH